MQEALARAADAETQADQLDEASRWLGSSQAGGDHSRRLVHGAFRRTQEPAHEESRLRLSLGVLEVSNGGFAPIDCAV